MALLTTTDAVSGSQRISVEKTVTAFVGIASALLMVLVALGVIDPTQANDTTTAIQALGVQVTKSAPVLLTISVLWGRWRSQRDKA